MGRALAWLGLCRRSEAVALAESARKLNHDLRGALSPALLLAERLERHGDPVVAQGGAIISAALERASEMGRDAGVLANGIGGT